MAEIIELRNSPHDKVQALLPWFVNRTLCTAEIEKVEAHLAECPECRTELAAERQLAAAMQSSSQAHQTLSWERLSRHLQAAPGGAQSLWMKRVPLGWAVCTPLACAAALALVVLNLPASPAPQPQYRALGASEAARPANLVVQFQPSSNVSDMQRALHAADARLVDGPTETGAYLLTVDPAKRALALKLLRDDQSIALAQPIDQPARE